MIYNDNVEIIEHVANFQPDSHFVAHRPLSVQSFFIAEQNVAHVLVQIRFLKIDVVRYIDVIHDF